MQPDDTITTGDIAYKIADAGQVILKYLPETAPDELSEALLDLMIATTLLTAANVAIPASALKALEQSFTEAGEDERPSRPRRKSAAQPKKAKRGPRSKLM
jgi:hypothetical protein